MLKLRPFAWLLHRIKKKPASIRIQSKGAPIRKVVKGDVTQIETDDFLEVELSIIKSVGVKHLAEVVEHHITTIMNSHSHMVRFTNGGTLKFAYNSAHGCLLITLRWHQGAVRHAAPGIGWND